MKQYICGPWLGEFGWELMTWVPALRNLRTLAGCHMVVVCSSESSYLYADFADTVQVYDRKGNRDRWLFNGKNPRLPTDILLKYPGHKWIYPNEKVCCQWERKYDRYGYSPSEQNDHGVGYTIVFHARRIEKHDWIDKYCGGSRNWKRDYYNAVASHFKERMMCSIGSKEGALHVEGTVDMRDKPLQEVCEMLSDSSVCVGTSSGPLHLAAMCGCPVVVWTDKKFQKSINGTNRQRYEKIWNPLRTPVTVIDKYGWVPPARAVIKEIERYLSPKCI